MNMNFFIMTNTSKGGHTEYGHTEYVIAGQDATGRRFRLDTSAMVNTEKSDREIREIQNRRIMRMLQSLAFGQDIDMKYWTEIEPAYESEAFYKLDANTREAIKQQHEEMYSL